MAAATIHQQQQNRLFEDSNVSNYNLSPSGTPRKIRFAPLPDPRRSVLVNDDGDEFPIPEDNVLGAHPHPFSAPPTTNSFNNDNDNNPDINLTPSTPTTPSAPSSNLNSDIDDDSDEKPSSSSNTTTTTASKPAKSWRRSIFKPFSSSSSSNPASVSSPSSATSPSSFNFSTEELLTLGTINLFRTSSRDSRRSTSSSNDGFSPLARWTSNTSLSSSSKSKKKRPSSSSGLSLGRSQSLNSNNSNSQQQQLRPRTGSGTRMLNGRIYGARSNNHPSKKNANANPFASARDTEPSFVEWGYGGMGSVKNDDHGQDSRIAWNKVQSGTSGMGDDGDDGSGMAWIKKRREEKERIAKEKEEAAKKAKEAEQQQQAVSVPDETTGKESFESGATSTAVGTPVSEEHHVLKAVNVPPTPAQALHRHHSHAGSHTHVRMPSSDGLVKSRPNTPATTTAAAEDKAELDDQNKALKTPSDESVNSDVIASSSNPSSTSSSDDEDEEDTEDLEEDDDDEDEDQTQSRKTSLGAGVEKISRHHSN